MNGTIIQNSPIAVDFWKLRECPQARLFFLTHLHGDHIAGLTPTWNYPIYCSEVTARLLAHHHQIRDDLLHTLTLDTPHIIYLDKEHRETMTVTLYDANHCPGAVMFLFEGYFGRILHTGDFRFQPSMISEESTLKEYKGRIDVLYLDNTYCSPMCSFPTRDEATDKIIDIIQNHPDHDIVLGLRSLGKETLLVKIALALKEWISVPSKFYESLQLLNAPDVFQSNDLSCRIRVEPFHKISNKFIENLNAKHKTIAILPTAIYCGIDAKPFENNEKVFVVPYSDHSSYTELMQFVSFLKPCKIIPVVGGSARGPFGLSVSDRANMSRFDKYLNVATVEDTQPVPDTVLRFMKGRALVPLNNVKQGVKRRKRIPSVVNVGAKKVRKGVVYDDSPEKTAQTDKSPIVNDDFSGGTLDKENIEIMSKTSNTTIDTEQNLQKDLIDSENEVEDINEDDVCDSEIELSESQGFEYNSDCEEISTLPENKEEALDFENKNKVNQEMQEEEIRLRKLQEVTETRKAEASDLEKSTEIDMSQESIFSLQEAQETPIVTNAKIMVKRPLEFVVKGKKQSATKSDCLKLNGDNEKPMAENKMSENDSGCAKKDQDKELLEDGGNDDNVEEDGTSVYCTAASTQGGETEWETASKKTETTSMADECESQSLLQEHSRKMPERQNLESITCNNNKGSKFHEACSAHLKHDNGSEEATNNVSAEESLIVLDGVSQDSNYSVIMINSDSEPTQPPNTQTTDLSGNMPEAVAEMFDDTLSIEHSGSESESKSLDKVCNKIDDSQLESDKHSDKHSQVLSENINQLNSGMDDVQPQSQDNVKQSVNYEKVRDAANDDKFEIDKRKAVNEQNENNKLALKNVSVIKWEPNFTKLRKQRFHQALTKFADGIKM